MTKNKNLKKKVRNRMAVTGETYMQALQHVQASDISPSQRHNLLNGITIVSGLVGTGKTTTLKSFVHQALDANRPVIISTNNVSEYAEFSDEKVLLVDPTRNYTSLKTDDASLVLVFDGDITTDEVAFALGNARNHPVYISIHADNPDVAREKILRLLPPAHIAKGHSILSNGRTVVLQHTFGENGRVHTVYNYSNYGNVAYDAVSSKELVDTAHNKNLIRIGSTIFENDVMIDPFANIFVDGVTGSGKSVLLKTIVRRLSRKKFENVEVVYYNPMSLRLRDEDLIPRVKKVEHGMELLQILRDLKDTTSKRLLAGESLNEDDHKRTVIILDEALQIKNDMYTKQDEEEIEELLVFLARRSRQFEISFIIASQRPYYSFSGISVLRNLYAQTRYQISFSNTGANAGIAKLQDSLHGTENVYSIVHVDAV